MFQRNDDFFHGQADRLNIFTREVKEFLAKI